MERTNEQICEALQEHLGREHVEVRLFTEQWLTFSANPTSSLIGTRSIVSRLIDTFSKACDILREANDPNAPIEAWKKVAIQSTNLPTDLDAGYQRTRPTAMTIMPIAAAIVRAFEVNPEAMRAAFMGEEATKNVDTPAFQTAMHTHFPHLNVRVAGDEFRVAFKESLTSPSRPLAERNQLTSKLKAALNQAISLLEGTEGFVKPAPKDIQLAIRCTESSDPWSGVHTGPTYITFEAADIIAKGLEKDPNAIKQAFNAAGRRL